MAEKRTWVSVLIAAAAIAVILGLVAIGTTIFWFRQHVNAQYTSRDSAVQEFSRERARFAGQEPLVELRSGESPIVHRAAQSSGVSLTALHVLAYDPEEERLIRASVPFWAARLSPMAAFSITSEDSEIFGKLQLTADDIARHGPGIVMIADGVPVHGARVLVWAE
jgi:hypothetical protein